MAVIKTHTDLLLIAYRLSSTLVNFQLEVDKGKLTAAQRIGKYEISSVSPSGSLVCLYLNVIIGKKNR